MLDWVQKSATGWEISVRRWQQRSGQCCTVLKPGTRSPRGWQPPLPALTVRSGSTCAFRHPTAAWHRAGSCNCTLPMLWRAFSCPLPSALCPLLAENKLWALAQTGWLPVCSVCVDAKGLATSEVATPSEENLLQSIETTLLLDLRPGNFLPQVSGLGDSVTDSPIECHRPFTSQLLKPSPTHQTFSPITSHTNTPLSSIPPWASCPFPKACATPVMSQITPFPCDPCPSPHPCPMCFFPSFPELLPVHPPHSLWSHILHPWGSTYLDMGREWTCPQTQPHVHDDVLSSTNWLWPPFRAFLFAVAMGQHQAEDAQQSPLKAMAKWSLKVEETFAIVQVWKNQQTRETFILGIKVHGQLMFASPFRKLAGN